MTRENYQETRQRGFIKNYKSLRHKEEPKFRKTELTNIHESNIKRPTIFAENNDLPLDSGPSNPNDDTDFNS